MALRTQFSDLATGSANPSRSRSCMTVRRNYGGVDRKLQRGATE